MLWIFYNCTSLTTLDLSNFDTGNVTNMCSMFNGCSNLTILDLSNFDIGNVTNMDYMFNNCPNLTSITCTQSTKEKITSLYGTISSNPTWIIV